MSNNHKQDKEMLAHSRSHLDEHRPAVPFGNIENGRGFTIMVALYGAAYPKNAEIQRIVPQLKPLPHEERAEIMTKQKLSHSLPPEVDEMVASNRFS